MKSLVAFVAIATLALPLASASPLDDLLAQATTEVDRAYGETLRTLDTLAGEPSSSSQPEDAQDEHDAAHADGEDASAPSEEKRHAPPVYGAPRTFGRALAPVAGLVPIPVTDAIGPLPRIDIGEITRRVNDAAPLAPAQAPGSVTTAPAAPASAPVSAQAAHVEAAAVAPELVVAGLVATAGAAASTGAAASLWDRLRRLGWLGALLYSRIAKERLLDHGTREQLLDTIRAKPGLVVADLATTTLIPRNTVTYHLRVLEREGLVSSTRNGRNRLYFAPGALPQRAPAHDGAPSPSRQQVVAAMATLRHGTTLAVAKAIGAQPGVDQKGICGTLGLSPSLAHWHADRLVASGLVDKRREGRFVRYYPGAAFDVVAGRS